MHSGGRAPPRAWPPPFSFLVTFTADDRANVGGFLEKLADEVTKRKVQRIELQFLKL